ncbi:tryptophan synthase beta subunit-like PLP-dependent enzyme [Phyllosticta capitalensis]|uniref:Tryptophan synthase beta subunit-like PLP-dependent enzyme n=1 Tax=Phyllosticta capitalensis TaxID=121624 RepID=A0ABR1YF04_9PEZI
MSTNIYHNPSAHSWTSSSPKSAAAAAAVEAFHASLPDHNVTPLVPLPRVAKELGLAHVLLKDESSRFGLPAFKILGASWAVHRSVAARIGLPPTVSPADLRAKLHHRYGGQQNNNTKTPIARLVTCTDGNWGRAVARMARHLALPVRIYVPNTMDAPTRAHIADEGADVRVVPSGVRVVPSGDYDASIAAARRDADTDEDALLVMDTSWPGYEDVPAWVVEGYATMLNETDRQLAALLPDRPIPACAIASVGVGSWAHAVTAHYKSKEKKSDSTGGCSVVAVEPTTAACLQTSLRAGHIVPIRTSNTIMCGMNCGTVSSLAWPVLRDGVDTSVVVSDHESHIATRDLHDLGVACGPCGAAPLAALRRLCRDEQAAKTLGLGEDAVVVLFSTEGARPYEVPRPEDRDVVGV